MVSGNEAPTSENCELLLEEEEIVTDPPLALKVTGWLELLPTSTLPKLIAVGLSINWLVVAPVPLKGIVNDPFGTTRLPVNEVAD